MTFRPKDSSLVDILYLSAASAFIMFYGLGRGSLASWDEAIYATVAKEIVLSGDWIKLTLGGQLWFDKPPLGIWITALFYKLFGINEFTARLFSSLCGFGTVLVTYLIGRKLVDRRTGFIGAAVLLTSTHFFRFARFGMLDAPLTFFLSLALYFFWLGRERNRYLIFSGVAIGLAVMAKGFAAFFIFPIVWGFCLLTGEQDHFMRSSYWVGVMIAAAIALPWHLYQSYAHRSEFMRDVVMRHLIDRTTHALEGHGGGYYFYIRTLVNKYHPWILIGIVSAPYFLVRAIKEREKEIIFLTLWMYTIFVIITMIQTKLAWYVLPVYPPLSLSVGYALSKMIGEKRDGVIRVLFLIVILLHMNYSHLSEQDYSRDIKGIAQQAKLVVPEKAVLRLYNYHEIPALSFYISRTGAYLDDPETFLAAAKTAPFYCLIHERDLAPFRQRILSLGLSEKASFEDLRLIAK